MKFQQTTINIGRHSGYIQRIEAECMEIKILAESPLGEAVD